MQVSISRINLYNTVESRDYVPPFVHARIGQKWVGGSYAGSLHFRVTTITDRHMPRGRAISSYTFSGRLVQNLDSGLWTGLMDWTVD